jgi:hypothetical protein
VARSRRVNVKVKVLMSFRPRLDHFREVAFLCGSPETPPELLNSCENLCPDARRELEDVFIAFDIVLFGSR